MKVIRIHEPVDEKLKIWDIWDIEDSFDTLCDLLDAKYILTRMFWSKATGRICAISPETYVHDFSKQELHTTVQFWPKSHNFYGSLIITGYDKHEHSLKGLTSYQIKQLSPICMDGCKEERSSPFHRIWISYKR